MDKTVTDIYRLILICPFVQVILIITQTLNRNQANFIGVAQVCYKLRALHSPQDTVGPLTLELRGGKREKTLTRENKEESRGILLSRAGVDVQGVSHSG